MHCNHCALVSSSGHMLGASLKEEIDKTECVIRMNNAPTAEYEKDVGSLTSVRVASHTSVPLLLKNERYYFQQSENTTYVFWGPERNMRRDGKGRVFNALLKIAKKYPNVQMFAVTRERIQYCDRLFQLETGKDRCSVFLIFIWQHWLTFKKKNNNLTFFFFYIILFPCSEWRLGPFLVQAFSPWSWPLTCVTTSMCTEWLMTATAGEKLFFNQ